MDLADLVSENAILPALDVQSKKQALHELAAKASELTASAIPAREIFDTLLQRERLGSTGLGRGIAIRMSEFKELDRIYCLFAKLEQPIDFDAHDDEPVDLVFLLLAPEHASGDHLKALACISRLLREPEMLKRLRDASNENDIFRTLMDQATSHAA